jgi:hypothetical protein
MQTTTPTILDQISAEKTKISERLARLDPDREKNRHSRDRFRNGGARADARQYDAASQETETGFGCRSEGVGSPAGSRAAAKICNQQVNET